MEDSIKHVPPLCVDLDGTLVKTDMFWECFVRMCKTSPWKLFLAPFWLLRGIAFTKHKFAESIKIDIARLPYDDEVLAFLKNEAMHAERGIVLCTGSDKSLALKISEHLGIFSQVIATDKEVNLTGKNKAEILRDRYGPKGFDYLGNEQKDMHIWSESRKVLVATDSSSLIKSVRKKFTAAHVFQRKSSSLMVYFKALRIHQWVKNLLIFVPWILDHRFFDFQSFFTALLAFVVFGLVASGTYIINDLFDLDSDRSHTTKRKRAFASGALSIQTGIIAVAVLFTVALAVSLIFLPVTFLFVISVYLVCTLLYSFKLKTMPVLDVCILAGLYTLRVIAGTVVIQAEWSFWLLAFSMFIFLSLALAKRGSELYNLMQMNRNEASGRGYSVSDYPLLIGMGVASGYISILIVALYINSEKVLGLYSNPEVLWVVCPVLLYWIGRIWLKTSRGEMDEDPIVFAIKDRVSWILALVCAVSIYSAYLLARHG